MAIMEKEDSTDTIFDEDDNDKQSLAKINFDLVDTGRWLLKVIAGPNNGAEFSMHTGSAYVVGTDPNSCDIVFYDTSVSRQHCRISVDKNDDLSIEDLKSRNGTTVDGEQVKTKKKLAPNAVVSVGTTAFTVYDREGEMHTIISPLLPAIVKVLQKEESKASEAKVHESNEPLPEKVPEPQELKFNDSKPSEKTAHAMGAFIVIGIVTGLFIIVGLGTATLFRSNPVVAEEQVDAAKVIDDILVPFPAIKAYYNKSTGVLQLIGHVLTPVDRQHLLYSLQGMHFIKEIDDRSVIIDEYSWQNINQALSENPDWRGISIHSPSAGKFVATGSLQTRKEAEKLSDYLANNFAYFDMLENRIIVQEDEINAALNILQQADLGSIGVQMTGNDLILTGGVAHNKLEDLKKAIEEMRKMTGVRDIKNQVKETAPDQAMINISDKYEVTGFSLKGNNYSVVINGRILSMGDELDGMLIKSVKRNAIFLEKDNVQYRIDFGK